MKALVLSKKVPYPSLDGESLVIEQDINMLQELGYETYLLTLNTNKHFVAPEITNQSLPTNLHFSSVEINTNISFIKLILNFFSSIPYNIIRFYSDPFKNKLLSLIKQHEFDIILFEGLHLAVYANSIKEFFPSQNSLIMRSHNVESEIWKRKSENENNFLKKIFLQYLAKKVRNFEIKSFAYFDKFITISDRDLNIFLDLGLKTKSFCLPFTLKDEVKKSTLKDKRSIFFLGSFDWEPNYKGISWFIEKVWAPFYQLHPQWTFYIAGRKMNLEDPIFKNPGIKAIGEVKNASTILNDYNIMVVPLFFGSGIRIKIIEALFYSKPIISTSIGAEGVYIPSQSDIIIADDEKSFLLALEELVKNEDHLETMGNKNKEFAMKYFLFSNQKEQFKKFLN